MRLKKPRIEPLAEEQWSPEAMEVLAPTRGMGGGKVFHIFATLAHHPKLLKRWMTFGTHVLMRSTLGGRERELVILRIGWLCRSEYEWGQHVVIGKQTGLTDEEIERITRGPDAPGWSEVDAALLRATDELHGDAFISDPTWAVLQRHFDTQQLIDLIFAVGQYNMVSMALNTLGVQLDPGLKGFPGVGQDCG